jgi:DNA polymerase V
MAPPKKSVCTSRSFGEMVVDLAALQEATANFVVRCAEKLRRQGSCAGVLTVFIRTNAFARTCRSTTRRGR